MTHPTHSPLGKALLWALAMGALTVSACSGDEPPTLEEAASMSEDEAAERARDMKDLSGVEACDLLTASEIEAATGISPSPPQDVSQVQGQLPMCNWSAAEGRNVVSLLVTRGGFSSYDEFLETTRSQMTDMGMDFSEEDWRHVPDVGDFGVWLSEGFAGGMLQVYDDGLMVQVDAEPGEGKDEMEAAKELAERVFDRID